MLQETFHITIVLRLLGNLLYAIIGGLPLSHEDKVLPPSAILQSFSRMKMKLTMFLMTRR